MYNNTGKIKSLQLLRAIAVLLVLHCHVLDNQPDHNSNSISFQQHFFYLQNFGAAGVDIFFVISGFIITIISYKYACNNEAFYFLIKRLIRIIPVYWLVSFFFIVRVYIISGRWVNTSALLKTISFFPFFDTKVFNSPVLGIGWTLSFELLFYLVIAIAMAVNKKRYLLIGVLFFLTSIGFSFITINHNILVNFLGNSIILEFLLGVSIGLVFLSATFIKPFVSTFFIIAGVTGLFASLFFGYGNISEAQYTLDGSLSLSRVLVWGIPSAFLVAGVVFKEKMYLINVPDFWVQIGDASYSIYLTHVLIIQAIYARWSRWGVLEKFPPDLVILISMIITVAGGYVFYKLIELPLLRFLNMRIGRLKASRKLLHAG
jgi:exopolysaccharide production protein ExoZ